MQVISTYGLGVDDWQTSQIEQLQYDPNSTLFELPTEYLEKSGLPSAKKIVLYCRPTFTKQFKFLREKVINENVFGWILGPPGTGKSTTALAFASTLDKTEWTVTWIHLSRFKFPVIVRFGNGEKKALEIVDTNIERIREILYEIKESKRHIVFVDGYTLNGPKHIEIQMTCYSWLEENRENKRLVIVCSMSARVKKKLDEDLIMKNKDFHVYSWRLEEYKEAVQQEQFFNCIKDNLDSSSVEQFPNNSCDPLELVNSKFYFAGGSPRFMFDYKTSTVIDCLNQSVQCVQDIIWYLRGTIGDPSDQVINRLFNRYSDDYGKKEQSIVSRYAAFKVAPKMGPELIASHANYRNPSMDGWLLEMLFFARLAKDGVTLQKVDKEKMEWKQSSVLVVDIKEGKITKFPENEGIWLKPKQWNQGGYDAIYIDKHNGLVRFVQITNDETRSLKIECFAGFLDTLRDSKVSFEIKTLEIVFIVELTKLEKFSISTITGQGLLKSFEGWEEGREKDRILILGMQGIC